MRAFTEAHAKTAEQARNHEICPKVLPPLSCMSPLHLVQCGVGPEHSVHGECVDKITSLCDTSVFAVDIYGFLPPSGVLIMF